MRWLGWTLACLLSAGSAFAEQDAEEPLDLEAILGTTAAKEDYVDVTKCILRHKIREVKVLDEKHIAFKVGRDEYYLVQLEKRCPGLNRQSTLMYETNSNRLCTRDSIRGRNGIGVASWTGPRCRIPSFQEITADQLALIKDTLYNKRR
ncbi:MAG: DUF6491 family protein [Gammaproteobacteria bacterium]|nr:DUF6491 family protein [Gammaproteobacteria bacterium]